MSEFQEIFKIEEIVSISCTCENCETEIIFKVGKARYATEDESGQKKGDPKRYPNCGATLNRLDEILRALQYGLQKAGAPHLNVRFRLGPRKADRSEPSR